jgi:hypothetical protein
MGLIKPSLPDLDYDQWRSQPRREQVRAMVVHWAEHDDLDRQLVPFGTAQRHN